MSTKFERTRLWPPLNRNQLLAIDGLASQKTGRIPANRGWKAAENTMNAALSFIAELYDHHEHTYHRRVLYQWENGAPNSWFVKIFTGNRFEVFYLYDPRGIYDDEGKLEVMRRFEALCQNHHDEKLTGELK